MEAPVWNRLPQNRYEDLLTLAGYIDSALGGVGWACGEGMLSSARVAGRCSAPSIGVEGVEESYS